MTLIDTRSKNKAFLPMFIIIVLTVVPMVVSWFLYRYHQYFNFSTLNHGVLIRPAIPMSDIGFIKSQRKIWQIVYMPSGCCDGQCKKHLFFLHQVREALGKDSERVNLVFAASPACQQEDLLTLHSYNFQNILFTTQQTFLLQAKFAHSGLNNFVLTDKIYLIDPHNNLIMYYPASADAMGILKDLKLLLRVSQIG